MEPTRGGKEWKKMNFDDIVAKVKECGKKTVAVSVAQDSAVLEAVHEAKRLGIADAILVGDEAKIREIAAGLNMDLSDYEIINEPDMIVQCLFTVDGDGCHIAILLIQNVIHVFTSFHISISIFKTTLRR